MKSLSILNDVLGPVMRGPSSSHTAGSYHLAALSRSLLGEDPAEAEITFDPTGSYGRVYHQQGSDLAFATGLLGWSITDQRFARALDFAPAHGLRIRFATDVLPEADHPNAVRIRLTGRAGRRLRALGRSIGGGSIEVTELEDWPVLLTGATHEVVVEAAREYESDVLHRLLSDGESVGEAIRQARGGRVLLCVKRRLPLADAAGAELRSHPGVFNLWEGGPLMLVKRGRARFSSSAEMIALADERDLSAGEAALVYESELLGLPEVRIVEEMGRRLEIMLAAVHTGLGADLPSMQLLRPSAGRVYAAEAAARVAIGGLHTRAAARAMAAMHVNAGMGVVCAAPTAGSAGVLPGVMTTLCEERGLSREQATRCLLAAGIVGMIVGQRATFAAELAGCQVEIGAAGAMAAAAVIEAAGGSARHAADAAAVCFQNTMGSVCDLVQGIVEIPCHTRNAVAASSAFVVADVILGGYENPIPLDETIDAVYAVGKMLPAELRCTALGGVAITPSAKALKRLR